MEQIRIMMYDRESFVLNEYDVDVLLDRIVAEYYDAEHCLSIPKSDGRVFVINKDYIMAIQIEDAD